MGGLVGLFWGDSLVQPPRHMAMRQGRYLIDSYLVDAAGASLSYGGVSAIGSPIFEYMARV